MTELEQLIAEKRELERRIKFLTTGSITHEMVKIDKIGYAGKYQRGKWAVFYKYLHVVSKGRQGTPEARMKWVPLVNGETIEEVVNELPNVIKDLTELYEEAKHGTDT
jgi:hypothetical protein